MKIVDHILTIGDHSVELPQLSMPATVTVWQVPTEYRESGYFVGVQPDGEPKVLPACSAADAVLIGSMRLPAHETAVIAAAKAERLSAINAACDAALAAFANTYPVGEVSSWPQQVKEAEALAADPNAATPLLAAIATPRGITATELAGRVIANAAAWSVIAGQIIGKRQALEDALEAAETLEAVQPIVW